MTAPRPIGRITIDFIDQSQQRYDTCGDWYYEGDVLRLFISKTKDERHQQLVMLHELVEALMCNNDGVTQEMVDAFDMGPGKNLDEPGNDPACPCHMQHVVASLFEQAAAHALRVNWAEYDKAVTDSGVRDGGG